MTTQRRLFSALTTACPKTAGLIAASILCALAAAPAAAQCTGFNMVQSSGASMVPGTTDIGNHGDDVNTAVALPFPVTLYGVSYNSVNAASNGNLQFTTNNTDFTNTCLPQTGMGVAVLGHWDDLRTDGAGEGIFTSISGTAPNRIFNMEWRSHYYSGAGTVNFEIRLFEDQSRIEIIYGTVSAGGIGGTAGIQHSLYPPTQFECNVGGLTFGLKLAFNCTADAIPPGGVGAASPSTVLACDNGSTTRLTVNVTPGFNPASTGLAVTADLSSIGGSAAQVFYNDATHGDVTANDSIYSFTAAIAANLATGNRSLPFAITDQQSRTGTGAIALIVTSCPVLGPDVFVGNIIDMANYGSAGNVTAYSIGTDACNMGDSPVTWFASVNQHPVIAQNMFRLKAGRFEQLGQSWLKHGFSSTNSNSCSTCVQPPLGGTQLGVNCSDAYGSGLNGSQGNLGPRSQVNATTAAYPYPFTAPGSDAIIGRRLQVYTSDVTPALNPGATYFAECHYVTFDDARWTVGATPAVNGLNNVSYRPIAIASPTAVPTFTGGTVQRAPAIFAWRAADPTVQIFAADYLDTSLVPAGIVARFWVAAKVTANGNGTWHYEYAVYNQNADRCGGSFSVPHGLNATITNIGFHGVFAHSGEPYPNTAANIDAWTGTDTGTAVTWTCPEPFVGPNGNNANAIRWGTMYNFRFDANIAPVSAAAVIGLFKPGTLASVTATGIRVPGLPCAADFNADGVLNPDDLADYIAAFFAVPPGSAADFNRDGIVDPDDLADFIGIYFGGC